MTKSLDKSRRTWDTDLADTNKDWIHCNGVVYDPSDNTIVVSGRTQGVVKLSEANEIVWIIAPHKGWETAGNGKDLNQYLLQPLDAQGEIIDDNEVVLGNVNHPDFEWNWYQHSPSILPNGNFMVFDNGDNRNYGFTGFNNSRAYSRAVEFKVDAENMTVQQVYSYGKERSGSTYSRIVSRADYLEEKDNVIFAPGSLRDGRGPFGKVIEVDKASGDVVFEASIVPPRSKFWYYFSQCLPHEFIPRIVSFFFIISTTRSLYSLASVSVGFIPTNKLKCINAVFKESILRFSIPALRCASVYFGLICRMSS